MNNRIKLKLTTVGFLLVAFTSCKKDPENKPDLDEGIFYGTVNTNLSISDNQLLNLDMNEDNKVDFQFYTDVFKTDIDQLEGFFVKPLSGNNILVIKLTGNPLFSSWNLMSFATGDYISAQIPSDHSWETANGLLTMKHSSESTSLIGRWSDGALKSMAVRVLAGGKFYFGWIRILYDKNTESIKIIDYALSKTAGAALEITNK